MSTTKNTTENTVLTPAIVIFKKQPGTNKVRWTLDGMADAPFCHTKAELLTEIGYTGTMERKGAHKEIGATGSEYRRPKYQIDLALCTKFRVANSPVLKLGAAESVIFDLLTKNGAMTTNDIALAVGKSLKSAEGTIGSLVRKQLVEKFESKFKLA